MNLKDLTGKTVRQVIDAALMRENASSGASCAANVASVPGGKGATQGAIGVGFDPNGHDRGIYPAPKKRQTKKPGVIKRVNENVNYSAIQCWVREDGEVLDASYTGGHERVAIDFFDIEEIDMGDDFGEDEYRGSDEAYKSGWIRVNAEGSEFGADWHHTTRSALVALKNIILESRDFNMYYFNAEKCSNKEDAYEVIQKLMRTLG